MTLRQIKWILWIQKTASSDHGYKTSHHMHWFTQAHPRKKLNFYRCPDDFLPIVYQNDSPHRRSICHDIVALYILHKCCSFYPLWKNSLIKNNVSYKWSIDYRFLLLNNKPIYTHGVVFVCYACRMVLIPNNRSYM